MGFVDPAAPLLATCGGDTVKLFNVSVESGDPCVLAYAPAAGNPVNAVKWNHTSEWLPDHSSLRSLEFGRVGSLTRGSVALMSSPLSLNCFDQTLGLLNDTRLL
jgi:hypothetical protein